MGKNSENLCDEQFIVVGSAYINDKRKINRRFGSGYEWAIYILKTQIINKHLKIYNFINNQIKFE